nr:M23 family metallopeptidase [Flavimaribacter sediminis]
MIIASGDSIRHWNIHPWMLGIVVSVVSVIAIGYLLATTYLVLRDDLIGASMAQQARVQYAYEDRIASLRVQVDRITSRQLLDQQAMEDKMARLIEQQQVLSSRHGRLDDLLQRATFSFVEPDTIPVPRPRPTPDQSEESRRASADRPAGAQSPELLLAYQDVEPAVRARARASETIFAKVDNDLHAMEREQFDRIELLIANAYRKAEAIDSIVESTGLPSDLTDESVGGPFIPAADSNFDTSLSGLETALDHLNAVSSQVRALPLANPVPDQPVSSNFGNRRDPFLKRFAFHSGMDFKTPYGFPIKATASGTVTGTGRHGGYGKMIEVDHGNGIVTRYAHLSRIHVNVGQKVEAGSMIGSAGSTGRSTGTHLHYEVRVNNKPLNPKPLLKAGERLASLL